MSHYNDDAIECPHCGLFYHKEWFEESGEELCYICVYGEDPNIDDKVDALLMSEMKMEGVRL